MSPISRAIDDLRLYNVALDSYDYEQIINGPIENTEVFVVSIDLPAVIEPGKGLKGTVTFESDTGGAFEDTVTFTSEPKMPPNLNFSSWQKSRPCRNWKRIESCISDYWMERRNPKPLTFQILETENEISDEITSDSEQPLWLTIAQKMAISAPVKAVRFRLQPKQVAARIPPLYMIIESNDPIT